jgi:hypothetical protein
VNHSVCGEQKKEEIDSARVSQVMIRQENNRNIGLYRNISAKIGTQ